MSDKIPERCLTVCRCRLPFVACLCVAESASYESRAARFAGAARRAWGAGAPVPARPTRRPERRVQASSGTGPGDAGVAAWAADVGVPTRAPSRAGRLSGGATFVGSGVGDGAAHPNPIAVRVDHHELPQPMRLVLYRADPRDISALQLLPQPAGISSVQERLP